MFVTLNVNVDAFPPNVTVEAEKLLSITGWLNAKTLILWLTVPTLATAAPSLPVTALFAMSYVYVALLPVEVPAVTGIIIVQEPSVLLALAGITPPVKLINCPPIVAVNVPTPGVVVGPVAGPGGSTKSVH